MEKLIELFKQHKRETGTSYEYILFRDNDVGLQARCIDDGKEIYIVRQAEILSKKMGFIQRLVENDKINYHKISDIIIYSQWRYTGVNKTTAQRVDENFLDLILMLLSIKDNPIEFLISILK